MACSQTGYDSIPRSAGIPRLHRHRTSERTGAGRTARKVCVLTTLSWLQEVRMGLNCTTMSWSGLGSLDSASSSESLCKAFSW